MKELSADLDMPYNLIRDVVIGGQSGFTKHIIESGTYHSVRWPHLGAFKIKARFLQVKKYMSGMKPIYKDMYRLQIKYGNIFPRKFDNKHKDTDEIISPK